MRDYRRAHVPGGSYFFTVNTYRRQTFLTDADVRSVLREAIHALWALPPGDEDFSHRWRVIKRMVTQRCQTRLHRPEWMNGRRSIRNQSTSWQHRFWDISSAMTTTSTGISITTGQAWVCGTGKPLAVSELPLLCQTGVAASELGKQHRTTPRR